jgi:hypothetical protein
MSTRTYNLRSRIINTTYIESSSNKVVKGRTSYYNNYEKIGIIESLTDKAYIRYGYNSVTLNVNEFLNTYNEFISNSEILIWRVNNIIEPINQDSLNHILSIIKETLLTKIKGNINDKLNDEININENYLVLNKLFYAIKDYVLLVIKYKAEQNIKYFENVIEECHLLAFKQ